MQEKETERAWGEGGGGAKGGEGREREGGRGSGERKGRERERERELESWTFRCLRCTSEKKKKWKKLTRICAFGKDLAERIRRVPVHPTPLHPTPYTLNQVGGNGVGANVCVACLPAARQEVGSPALCLHASCCLRVWFLGGRTCTRFDACLHVMHLPPSLQCMYMHILVHVHMLHT